MKKCNLVQDRNLKDSHIYRSKVYGFAYNRFKQLIKAFSVFGQSMEVTFFNMSIRDTFILHRLKTFLSIIHCGHFYLQSLHPELSLFSEFSIFSETGCPPDLQISSSDPGTQAHPDLAIVRSSQVYTVRSNQIFLQMRLESNFPMQDESTPSEAQRVKSWSVQLMTRINFRNQPFHQDTLSARNTLVFSELKDGGVYFCLTIPSFGETNYYVKQT